MSWEMRLDGGRGEMIGIAFPVSLVILSFSLQTCCYRHTHHISFTFVSGFHGNLLSILKRACVCVAVRQGVMLMICICGNTSGVSPMWTNGV